ncbi:hypothetical protein [Synechococcus sp. A15-28]|uniref:hypothetical protein n=1 Tax=Synechococcus sp. A15-28 TaxID=1050638 RepID=UPI001646F65E|nr:hypothetical protein [Synechococcus sp. A15-28]QNI43268.1 hypothetical protein SynA1528_02259 [Synechococcus sp. A15-28]
MADPLTANSMPKANPVPSESTDLSEERILCQHCRRTASNGIRCLGMCVADSDY